jgi:hypothetical protein
MAPFSSRGKRQKRKTKQNKTSPKLVPSSSFISKTPSVRPLGPNQFPKALPLNITTVGIKLQHRNLEDSHAIAMIIHISYMFVEKKSLKCDL